MMAVLTPASTKPMNAETINLATTVMAHVRFTNLSAKPYANSNSGGVVVHP